MVVIRDLERGTTRETGAEIPLQAIGPRLTPNDVESYGVIVGDAPGFRLRRRELYGLGIVVLGFVAHVARLLLTGARTLQVTLFDRETGAEIAVR
jgi:hypothetical protein